MYEFTITPNLYLKQRILSFYHTDYTRFGNPGNPDYINILKNTYNSYPNDKLRSAIRELRLALLMDLPEISKRLQHIPLTICTVPRAKNSYHANQLLFRTTVGNMTNELNGFHNGIDYIIRNTNTRTTHLGPATPNYNNDGDMPYPGITANTCRISNNVRGADILLIDDIYTKTINIDEDAIQALLNLGANSVIFYAIGRTTSNRIEF